MGNTATNAANQGLVPCVPCGDTCLPAAHSVHGAAVRGSPLDIPWRSSGPSAGQTTEDPTVCIFCGANRSSRLLSRLGYLMRTIRFRKPSVSPSSTNR